MYALLKKNSEEVYGPFNSYDSAMSYGKSLSATNKYTVNSNIITILDFKNANPTKSTSIGFSLDVYPKEGVQYIVVKMTEAK